MVNNFLKDKITISRKEANHRGEYTETFKYECKCSINFDITKNMTSENGEKITIQCECILPKHIDVSIGDFITYGVTELSIVKITPIKNKVSGKLIYYLAYLI